jgi:acyl-CoA thioesterase-2
VAFDLANLLGTLNLASGENESQLIGQNYDIDYRRVFGGQLLGQFVMAAQAACPGKAVKSLSVAFPREGDTSRPITYDITKPQDGRTFGTVNIVAGQDPKTISTAQLSMHVVEPGPGLQTLKLPAGSTPDAGVPTEIHMMPFDIRVLDGVDLSAREAAAPTFGMWLKADSLGAGDPFAISQALIAHATDLTVIGTALRPIDGVSQADTGVKVTTAVTTHSMWFHAPFRLDEWVLVNQESPVIGGGRAFGRGDIFSQDGTLVASFAQEALVRFIDGS